MIAGALGAAACWRAGRLRAALALGAACALLRVEAWPFLRARGRGGVAARPGRAGAAGRARGRRARARGSCRSGSAPATSLRSGARARIPNPGQPALADVPALASLRGGGRAAAVAAVGRRAARAARAARPHARGAGRGVDRAGGGDGAGRVLRRAALLAAGRARWSRSPGRRARARRAGRRGSCGGRSPRSRLVAAAPRAGGAAATCARAQAHQWALGARSRDAWSRPAGGRDAVLACGRPYVGRLRGPLMAYALDVTKRTRGARRRARRAPSSSARGSPPTRRVDPRAGPPFAPVAAAGEWEVLRSALVRVP